MISSHAWMRSVALIAVFVAAGCACPTGQRCMTPPTHTTPVPPPPGGVRTSVVRVDRAAPAPIEGEPSTIWTTVAYMTADRVQPGVTWWLKSPATAFPFDMTDELIGGDGVRLKFTVVHIGAMTCDELVGFHNSLPPMRQIPMPVQLIRESAAGDVLGITCADFE